MTEPTAYYQRHIFFCLNERKNGEVAIEKFKQGRYDAIVLDCVAWGSGRCPSYR